MEGCSVCLLVTEADGTGRLVWTAEIAGGELANSCSHSAVEIKLGDNDGVATVLPGCDLGGICKDASNTWDKSLIFTDRAYGQSATNRRVGRYSHCQQYLQAARLPQRCPLKLQKCLLEITTTSRDYCRNMNYIQTGLLVTRRCFKTWAPVKCCV